MTLPQHAITEDDIAGFLVGNPGFFERHAQLLATIRLSSGHSGRVISLPERQAGMLRDKIKTLEARVGEMVRNSQDNAAIAAKLQNWTLRLLQANEPGDLPQAIVQGLISEFELPQAALKIWDVSPAFADSPFAAGVSGEAQAFAAALAAPYCGANTGFEAANWLPEPELARSLALIPLRASAQAPLLGLLVLASPDPERFHGDLGTEFLDSLGKLAGAALLRLRAQPGV